MLALIDLTPVSGCSLDLHGDFNEYTCCVMGEEKHKYLLY